jgi:hypothetical protein
VDLDVPTNSDDPTHGLEADPLGLADTPRLQTLAAELANFVTFRLQEGRTQSLLDYYDFLRRTRWKLEQRRSQSRTV